MKTLLVLFFCAVFLSSCGEEELLNTSSEHYYNLNIDGVVIPVLVRGNTASGKFLLFIQGGPGYPSIDFAKVDFPKWKNTLEEDHAVVYYDQRGYGNKQGNFEPEAITIDTYLDDIHEVARFISQKYDQPQIFLFGHSFGGGLAHRYDMKYGPEGFNVATISICGPVTDDGDLTFNARWTFRKQMLIRVSESQIEKGVDVAYWQEALQWIKSVDKLDTYEEFNAWNRYVYKAEIESPLPTVGQYLKVVFGTGYNIFPYLDIKFNDKITDALLQSEQQLSILDDLGQISRPTLFFGSFYDNQAPLEELQYVYDKISSERKEFLIYENAGHYLFVVEPERFAADVKGFTDSF